VPYIKCIANTNPEEIKMDLATRCLCRFPIYSFQEIARMSQAEWLAICDEGLTPEERRQARTAVLENTDEE